MYKLAEAYLLGLLSSFTPCVFPLIPITLALFGAREAKSRLEGLSLGLCYVLGIALTYTTLGVLSARLGIIFGSFLGNLWVILFLSGFLLIITLYTLEIISLNFFSSLQTKASSIGGKGFSGAFLMGTVSGLVAAPCIGPALVVILSIAAKSQDTAWGAALLFSYSLGLGTIFLVLAAYSDLISKLPKSGKWMNYVKYILACLLVAVIIFLCQSYINILTDKLPLLNKLSVLISILIFALILTALAYKRDIKHLRLVSAIFLTFSSWQIYNIHINAGYSDIIWHADFDLALKLSAENKKPVIVDLYADWCAACKEFEQITFPDPEVQQELRKFITAKIDFTDSTTEIAVRLTEKYEVLGLPVILILKPDGSGDEFDKSRITGFLGPKEFTQHISEYSK